MSYQHIEGLNPSQNLEDYYCVGMLDTDNSTEDRLACYRRVKTYLYEVEDWLNEMAPPYVAHALINDLRSSLEADVRKWRQAIEAYKRTR